MKMGTSIINKMYRLAVLLPSVFCTFSGMGQTLPERLSYVLEVQDMEMGIKLYNEITEADLSQLPDSSLFDYHYLGGYLNSEIPNHEKAVSHLLEAKKICDKVLGTHSIGYMEIMRGLGDEYIELGQYDEALAVYQEGIVKSMYVRNIASEAFGNLIMGVQGCYERKGWLNEIPSHLYDAWGFWAKDEEPFATYNYYPLWSLEQFYRRYKMYDKALQVSDMIIKFISEKVGAQHPEMAEELYLRGNTLVDMGRNNDAVETYYKALSILKVNKVDKDRLYGLIAGNLLMAIISTGRWSECDNILKDIKNYGGRNVNDADIYKNVLFSAANRFNSKGNYAKALSLNTELLELSLSDKERTIIENQTNTIKYNRDIINALCQLEEQFRTFSQGSAEWFEAGHKLSSAYFLQKKVDKNICVLRKMYDAIAANTSTGEDYLLWVLNNLYGICFEKEEYNDALRYAIEKWNYISSVSDITEDYLYYALNDVVVAKLRSNHLEGIDDNLEKVGVLCSKLFSEQSENYSTHLHNQGRAYQLQGRLNEAKQIYLRAIALQIKNDGVPINRTVQYLMEVEKQITDEELDL